MADLKRIDREISRLEREADGYWDSRVWDAYAWATDEMARLDLERRDVRRQLKAPRGTAAGATPARAKSPATVPQEAT